MNLETHMRTVHHRRQTVSQDSFVAHTLWVRMRFVSSYSRTALFSSKARGLRAGLSSVLPCSKAAEQLGSRYTGWQLPHALLQLRRC